MGSPVDVTSPRHIPGHLLDVPEVLTMDFTAYLVPGKGKQFQSHCPRLLRSQCPLLMMEDDASKALWVPPGCLVPRSSFPSTSNS